MQKRQTDSDNQVVRGNPYRTPTKRNMKGIKKMMNVEVNVISIKNLVTAEAAREKATSWKNEELQKCLSTLMIGINSKANSGGLSGKFDVKVGRPFEFYNTLEQTLITLGYEVEKPHEPHLGGYAKAWKISW